MVRRTSVRHAFCYLHLAPGKDRSGHFGQRRPEQTYWHEIDLWLQGIRAWPSVENDATHEVTSSQLLEML
jgi:hypothetical protein